MIQLDIKITNILKVVPAFSKSKTVTNKRTYYNSKLDWLIFEVVFNLTKNK